MLPAKKKVERNSEISLFPTTVFGDDSLARLPVGARELVARPVEKENQPKKRAVQSGLVGRVVMTCDRKESPLVENFLSPNFEIDGS